MLQRRAAPSSKAKKSLSKCHRAPGLRLGWARAIACHGVLSLAADHRALERTPDRENGDSSPSWEVEHQRTKSILAARIMCHRALGCPIANEPLGVDHAVACGLGGNGARAAVLNALLDEWCKAKSGELPPTIAQYGTVDWLFREYKQTKA